MNKNVLKEWIETGREIEFTCKGNDYSITYYNDNRKDYISFCKAYDETLDVSDVDTLWNSTYKGMKFSDLWASVRYDDITLY